MLIQDNGLILVLRFEKEGTLTSATNVMLVMLTPSDVVLATVNNGGVARV